MIKQYYLSCLSHASYMVWDAVTKRAAIVDPQRDIDGYLADAAELGLSIEHVLLTHFHADFVAGHLELEARCGARIHLGAAARADYDFEPLEDGAELSLGALRIVVMATPGHTPEGVCLVVHDPAAEPGAPHAVLTGDTLFIGDVGRPDLLASSGVSEEQLAGLMYDSLHGKLLGLPDATLVYPAHGAGSSCGRSLSTDTVSTIGAQRLENEALRVEGREDFIAMLTAPRPAAPAYFAYDAQLNKAQRPVLSDSMASSLVALRVEDFLAARAAGATVLDSRSADAYAAGHVQGSVNIGLGGRYASWCGQILDPEASLLVIAEPGEEQQALLRLGRIGFDRVKGFLAGGPAALAGRAELVVEAPRWSAETLAQALEGGDAPLVLDVRTRREFDEDRLATSLNIPVQELADRLADVPVGRPVAIHCLSGYRSAIAIGLLESRGLVAADLTGGIKAWRAAGLPTVRG